MNPIQIIAAAAVGVVLLIVVLVLAIRFPTPTSFQILSFRVALALAAAGVAAIIPGFFTVNLDVWNTLLVQGGSALGVFLLVFMVNPAVLPASVRLSFPEKVIVQRHLDLVNGQIPGQPAVLLPTALGLPSARLSSLYNKLL